MRIIDHLRVNTRRAHASIERTVDLRRSLASIEAYRSLLERFWGFYAPWELTARGWIEDPVFWRARVKTPWLRQDLLALGCSAAQIDQLPLCLSLPPMASRSATLGSMYVLEGATLGGEVISREAAERLGQSIPRAFFSSYGARVEGMWRGFGDYLGHGGHGGHRDHSPMRVDVNEAIAGARATFASLEQWLALPFAPELSSLKRSFGS